ncbi:hypothetical protein ACOMHN_031283 [Nucella lapillus]
MGSTHAKKHKEEEEGAKNPFNAYFSPARERAYLGPPLEYLFVDTQVTVRPQADGFTRTPSLSSEDEGHYALLEQPYARGFRLLHFTRVPGGLQRTGHCGAAHGAAVLIDFQGVFCRGPSACGTRGVTELRVEKAWLQASRLTSGLLTRSVHHVLNSSHVEESVRRGAQGGERLLCVGATGQEDCGVSSGTTGGTSSGEALWGTSSGEALWGARHQVRHCGAPPQVSLWGTSSGEAPRGTSSGEALLITWNI